MASLFFEQTVISDLAFKISTKYTFCLLIGFICISLGNEFFRNVAIDCSANPEQKLGSIEDRKKINDYCWNDNMQGYYSLVWLGFGLNVIFAYAPHHVWKEQAMKTIKPLVKIKNSIDLSEERQRLNRFLLIVGFNASFAWWYVFWKVFTVFSPIGQWIVLCIFLGDRFKYYGIDVLSHFMFNTAYWPDPMEALFPKMAKCEWMWYNIGGDIVSVICMLPMNYITQWLYFIYWLWMAVTALINVLTLFPLIVHILPSGRRHKYRKIVELILRNDIQQLHTIAGASEASLIRKTKEVIHINMDFGDSMVLHFMEKNMPEGNYRAFVKELAYSGHKSIRLFDNGYRTLPYHSSLEVNTKFRRNFQQERLTMLGIRSMAPMETFDINHVSGFRSVMNARKNDLLYQSNVVPLGVEPYGKYRSNGLLPQANVVQPLGVELYDGIVKQPITKQYEFQMYSEVVLVPPDGPVADDTLLDNC